MDPSARFSNRSAGLRASEIRALFAVASRPGVVSLAGGMPAAEALPGQVLARILGEVAAQPGALQYATGQGDPVLRELICTVMAHEGVVADADDVVVTTGAQQALDLVTAVLADPGDVVLAESPSYVGALATFSAHGLQVRHVPDDGGGLSGPAIAELVGRARGAGRRVAFLYTVPNFANPSGVTLSASRRAEVLAMCDRIGLQVVEDNPYGLLRLEGEPLPSLRASDPGVVYLGSFSKILAPGLRVGWALAPPEVTGRLVLAAEAAMLCHSGTAQLAVARYLADEPWTDHVKALRELYWERRQTMVGALSTLMPRGTRWRVPEGGFFLWLSLPEGARAKEMLPRAIREGVAYVPGTGFFANGAGDDHLRLSYSYPEPAAITLGVRRLARVVREAADTDRTRRTPS
ncbi:DNA-binding transcriptional regulator, MocR family, contains an aminotransferase domain [Lentzea fradiae]|uniref:DNA-binding transcriptional regulator, MocR family, contains an aminotransferase domain n=1 Tax=Lentzea fradiae TaxID=200378 RepID=A0A1G7UN89_9PSEU|nr:PLP-dependent aminotransferase family protein [Lentzea fradiae]SDG48818.1 DNA-binding transcriptional regulator, MocR family, contains an aminotransferase domain [Lentzea fradiae]